MARTRSTSQPSGLDLLVPTDGRARKRSRGGRLSRPTAPSRPVGQSRAERVSLRARFDALVAEFKAAPLRWRQLAFLTFGVLGVIVALGALYDVTGEPGHFRLRGEIQEGFYIPVLFSWAILLIAGLGSAVRALWGITRVERLAWLGVAGLFAVMAFDELLMIHERLESHIGIDWQVLYLPVFAVGGLAWLALLLPMRRWSLQQVMWIGAAVLWFASQILEKLEYTSDDVAVNGFKALDGTEKVFQFTGSSLFMLAALLGLARIRYSGKAAGDSAS